MSIATGVSAGMTEAVIVTTPDLIKIRLQDKANVSASPHNWRVHLLRRRSNDVKQAGKYKNTTDCVAKIFKQEGFPGFFKGMEATIWRHAVWNGGYFGVIQWDFLILLFVYFM